jgi:hypothetical protein
VSVDLVNAVFEGVAAVLAWLSVCRLKAERHVAGVYWPQIAWTALWSLWCAPYYYSVGHYASLALALVREGAVVAWLGTLWWIRSTERR